MTNKNQSDSEHQPQRERVSLLRAAFRELLKEFVDVPEFLRQRNELLNDPRLAFEHPHRGSWKGPFKFAILAGVYLGLVSELLFSSWNFIPASFRNAKFIEMIAEEQKYVEQLELSKARIEETPIDGIKKRITRYNERVAELQAARAVLPPDLAAHEAEDLKRERGQIEKLSEELQASLASGIESRYRDDPEQLDNDISEAREGLEHMREITELYDRLMEFNIAAFGIGLPVWIAVSAYAFRFFASVGRRKKPIPRKVKDGISLYLVPAALFWYYIISAVLGTAYFCVLWTHPMLSVTRWYGWIWNGAEVVGFGTIVWLLYRVVKRAGEGYPTGVGPWRVLLSLAASFFVYGTLYMTLLFGVVAVYVHFKAPWVVDVLVDGDETPVPIQQSTK